MGGFEPWSPDQGEPLVKYHPLHALVLTLIPVKPGSGQCQLGSLTGAVSSTLVGPSGGNVGVELGYMLEPPLAKRRSDSVTRPRPSHVESGATRLRLSRSALEIVRRW